MAKQKIPQKSSAGAGVLLTLMHRGLGKLGKWLADSSVVRFFMSYDEMEDYAASSLTVGGSGQVAKNLKKKFSKKPRRELGTETMSPKEVGIYVPGSLPRSMKNRISEAIEGSLILGQLTRFLQKLLYMPMMYYGVFLFSYGLFTTVSQAMLYFWLKSNDASVALDLFVGLSLVLLSLLIMFKGYDPLMDSLLESKCGSFIMRMFMDRPHTEMPRKKHHSAGLFFIVGMLLGLLTLATPPLMVLATLLLIVFLIGVFFVPEVGVCALLFVLPMLSVLSVSPRVPVIAILYIGGCLLLKVLVGKRSITLDFTDGWVLIFLAIVLSTAPAERQTEVDSAFLYGAMISGYFVLSNILRSTLWIRRALNAISMSAFVVSIAGIADCFLPIDCSFLQGASDLSPVLFLIATIPLALVSMLCRETKRERAGHFMVFAAETAYLVLLGSDTGLWALVAELLFFFLFYTRKTWTVLLIMLLSLPIVSYWVSPDFTGLWTRVTQNARGQIWKGLGSVFEMAPLSGIGMDDSILQKAIERTIGSPDVDLTLSNTFLRILVQVGIPGLIVFAMFLLLWYVSGFTLLYKCGTKERYTVLHLGFMAALTGLLLAGNLTYLWSDSCLLLLFWMCAGIARALRRHARRHQEGNPFCETTVIRNGVQCIDRELSYAEFNKKD